MRSAIGLIAGPDSPAVMLAMLGRRVSGSMAMREQRVDQGDGVGTRVLGGPRHCAMLVTFGDSLTIKRVPSSTPG